jgi:CRISPR-associated exonuclease Cas4
MPLSSTELGIAGVADLVEFHVGVSGEVPYPVEYKRGSPKAHRADEVQLCGQALCLEAMLNQRVEQGALFYGAPRRRKVVTFDAVLRQLTLETIYGTREMFVSGRTPPAEYEARRCDSCSLVDLCQPHLAAHAGRIDSWLKRQLDDE